MRRHGTTSAGDKILRGRLGWAASFNFGTCATKLRQLGDVRRDPLCLIAGEQLGRNVRYSRHWDVPSTMNDLDFVTLVRSAVVFSYYQ
jgi:hypothetical protein